MAGASASPTGGLWRILRIVGWILVVAVALFVVGWILELVRFAAAQLPAVDAVGDMSIWQILVPRGALERRDDRRGSGAGRGGVAGGAAQLEAPRRLVAGRRRPRSRPRPGLAASGGGRGQHPDRRRADRDRRGAGGPDGVRHARLPGGRRLAGGAHRHPGLRGRVVRALQGRPGGQAPRAPDRLGAGGARGAVRVGPGRGAAAHWRDRGHGRPADRRLDAARDAGRARALEGGLAGAGDLRAARGRLQRDGAGGSCPRRRQDGRRRRARVGTWDEAATA